MDLTEWLSNGTNHVTLSVDRAGSPGPAEATLELVNMLTGETLLSLAQQDLGETSGSFEIDGLPGWAWDSATPQEDDSGLVAAVAAVAALHGAYGASDIAQIVATCAPFFADQALIGGPSATAFLRKGRTYARSGNACPPAGALGRAGRRGKAVPCDGTGRRPADQHRG